MPGARYKNVTMNLRMELLWPVFEHIENNIRIGAANGQVLN